MEQRLVDFVKRITAAGMKVMVSGWARHETTPSWRAPQIVASREQCRTRAYLEFLKRHHRAAARRAAGPLGVAADERAAGDLLALDGPDWTVVQRDIYRELRAFAPN